MCIWIINLSKKLDIKKLLVWSALGCIFINKLTIIYYYITKCKILFRNPTLKFFKHKHITRNVGQDGGHDKKLRNKMASDNARNSIGI
jgi:hypothetical protein